MISMQLSMTVAESQVEDYAAVYGARLAPACGLCGDSIQATACQTKTGVEQSSDGEWSGTDARCDANILYIGVVTITSDV